MKNKPDILFIEDEHYFREFVSSKLSEYGHVTECSNLEEALSIIDSSEFDIIITDLDLTTQGSGLRSFDWNRTA